MIQQAAMAVACGMADVVACFTAISFTRERQILGGPGDAEGTREEGGTHGESPPYGLTAPAGGAALAMQRYMHLYGATSEQLAAVPIAFRKHALKSPHAVMKEPLTLAAHQASRMVVDPLRLFDCSPDHRRRRGRSGYFGRTRKRPEAKAGVHQRHAGHALGARRVHLRAARARHQPADERLDGAKTRELAFTAWPESSARTSQGLYTYDAFSPLVLFTLERFGFCGPGEAARWVQDGRIELGGELPMNTSGGLLSEAHVGGWNSILEMVRQLRGTAGERQIANARHLQWATAWGDSVVLRQHESRCRASRRTTSRSGKRLREHRFVLPYCTDCGKAHLPPGPVCPFCFSDRLEWRPASGRGRISTWTVVHKAWFPAFADEIPYNVVQVELDEGPRLTANVVGCRTKRCRSGCRSRSCSGMPLPRFRPVSHEHPAREHPAGASPPAS